MLNFAALTSIIHLNLIAYEKEIKQKKQKIGENVWRCRTFNVPLPMSKKPKGVKAPNAKQEAQVSALAVKPVKEHPIAKKMGDFFIDVAKLIFGGVILAGLMKQEIDYVVLVLCGSIAVLLLVLFGIWLIKYANKK